jgi:Fe-S cluster assembly protein SufB
MAATRLSQQELAATNVGEYKYGFHDDVTPVFRTRRGLDEEVVREISAHKQEPEWMTALRVKSYRHFVERKLPRWGPICR